MSVDLDRRLNHSARVADVHFSVCVCVEECVIVSVSASERVNQRFWIVNVLVVLVKAVQVQLSLCLSLKTTNDGLTKTKHWVWSPNPVRVQVFTLNSLRLCLFQQWDSSGSTANNVWPSLCSMSTLSSLISRWKWNNFRKNTLEAVPWYLVFICFLCSVLLSLCFLILIIIIAVFMFVYCSLIWVICSRVHKLLYAVFLPGTIPQLCSKKEGVLSILHPPSVCPGFNSCQWVAVFFFSL